MNFFELLSFGFIQRAIVAGCFIAILCSILGNFLVLRKLSLIGDGLAHVTFGSVAVGLLLNLYPMYVAIPLTLLSGYGILLIVEKAKLYGDAAIGIVSSAGVSLGILISSIAGGFNIDLFSYLFGNILAVSNEEVLISVLLSVAVIIVIICFYHQLVSTTFDEDLAKVSGIKTKRINVILILLISLTVVLSMKIIGIMLVSSFLILPSVSSLQFARSFKEALFLSCIFSLFSVFTGIIISFSLNLPTGAVIVLINLCIFLISFLLKKLNFAGL
jgi:zinc transport system permease protein